MKIPFFALFAVLCAASIAHAQDSGTLGAIDRISGTITLKVSSGVPRVYRTRPSTEVVINSERAPFAALEPGMQAKITTAEPGVAARVSATGMAKEASAKLPPTNKDELASWVSGTKWTWGPPNEKNNQVVAFDGGRFIWLGSGDSRKTTFTGSHSLLLEKNTVLLFNEDFSKFEVKDFGGRGRRVGERVP